MGLYRGVRDKDDIVDGAIDAVVAEIGLGEAADNWQAAMRELAKAARRVMLRHTWAPRVLTERKNVGPATLRHIDRVSADPRVWRVHARDGPTMRSMCSAAGSWASRKSHSTTPTKRVPNSRPRTRFA